MPLFTLSKVERLKSKKAINRLFTTGKTYSCYPLRVVYYLDQTLDVSARSIGLRFTTSVPKRNFSNAVDRNRIKRKIKEAYRLNKSALAASQKENTGELQLMFIYTAKEDLPFDAIQAACVKALEKLGKSIS